MQYTERYGLKKPETTDKIKISDLNDNADIVDMLLADNACKNLLENTATSQTVNGVTFTVNEDKSVTVKGTATTETYKVISTNQVLEPSTNYILNGVNENSNCFLRLRTFDANGNVLNSHYQTGTDKAFTTESNCAYVDVYMRVLNGTVLEDYTFYPMIRKAEIKDDTYEPYCMSNKELTEEVENGVVNSANKLATSRYIGEAKFDGSSGITLSEIMGQVKTKTSGTTNGKYTKIARIDVSSSVYNGCAGAISVTQYELNKFSGVLNFYFRTDKNISTTNIDLYWTSLSDKSYADTIFAVKVSDGIFDLYYRLNASYITTVFTLFDCFARGKITMYEEQELVDTIEPVATSTLQSVASKAISDGNGNVIADTYATKAEAGTGGGTGTNYEEGEWTPSMQGLEVVESTKCYYKKVGKVVFIQAYMKVTGAISVINVAGLPYPVDASASYSYGSAQNVPVHAQCDSTICQGVVHGGSGENLPSITFQKSVSASEEGIALNVYGYYFTA